MSTRKKDIFAIFDSKEANLANINTTFDKEKLNRIIANIYSPGPSFQYIFDFASRKMEYMSPSLQETLGYDHKGFGVSEFTGIIHPDDFPHFTKCEEIAGHFYFNFLQQEEMAFFKKSYQFRMQSANGDYHLILHQAIAMGTDEQGRMAKVLGNQSIIDHISKVNNYKMSFIDIRGGKSYTNISAIEDLSTSLKIPVSISQREVEVLRCISEGMKNTEIANELNISAHTVRTHRNNILKNYPFKTIPEAITYCVREGVL